MLDSGHSIPRKTFFSHNVSALSALPALSRFFSLLLSYPILVEKEATEPDQTACLAYSRSSSAGHALHVSIILLYTILWTYLADRCTHSSPTGANEKGELFVFRSSLFARIFRPQHVQVQVPSSLYSDALLPSRAALEINAAAMRHSPTSPLSSSCTHLSPSFTAPGNDQGGKKPFPRTMAPTSPE